MSEIVEVLSALQRLHTAGVPAALATIVAVQGSTYRREGARLLVPAEGDTVGTISGGCLEGDIEERARVVMQTGQPELLTFDLTADDEAVWGWGLGCNGRIEVLVERAEHAAPTAAALEQAIAEERSLAAVTVLSGAEVGRRLLVHADGQAVGSLGDPSLDRAAVEEARAALARGTHRTVTLTAPQARLFVEVIEPPPRLVVCGAGHDAIPLVAAAARLGWRVEVVDDRRAMLTSERFPSARRLVHVDRPQDAAGAVGADRRTYVVVMSHNYLRDLDYLRSFLGSPVAYLGVLGPRRRLERLLGDLAREGVEPSEEDRRKLYGPAGLDIGADGPEEIAVAIIAEIMAVRSGRSGGPLRGRPGPIHDRVDTVRAGAP